MSKEIFGLLSSLKETAIKLRYLIPEDGFFIHNNIIPSCEKIYLFNDYIL